MIKSRSCFLHVQKSGGSSVIARLKSALGAEQVFHANESRYQQTPVEVLLARYPVVAGHFTFAQLADSLFANTFLFTFLRDPIDRVLSHYYYYRGLREAPCGDARIATAKALDLDAFVAALPDRVSPWSNWQTFLFSGASDVEQPAAELLPAALWNLERLDFVGIHDEFEEGMRRLFAERGWPSTDSAPRINVTGGRLSRNEIAAQTRRHLEDLNTCDAVLFAHARDLWARRQSGKVQTNPKPPLPAIATAPDARAERGTRDIVFTGLSLRGDPCREEGVVHEGDRVFLELCGASSITMDDLTVGIRITDAFGVEVYGVNTRLLGIPVRARAGATFQTTFAFDMILAPGTYQITVAVHAADDHLHKCYHWIDNAMTFECRRGDGPAFSGLVDLKAVAVLT